MRTGTAFNIYNNQKTLHPYNSNYFNIAANSNLFTLPIPNNYGLDSLNPGPNVPNQFYQSNQMESEP